MSELSRQARRAMRAKIHRITKGESGKVDASDYGPEEVLDAGVKTGLRPVSRRAFKKGGKVVANEGKEAAKHAGKKPRNGHKPLSINALVNRNVKDANEEREGVKHIGGLKTGGRAKKEGGGPLSTMGGDLYGLRNNPNPNRSTLLKKVGRACKEGGGRLDEPRSGGTTMDSTTQKFRAAAAKAEADRVARTGNASAQDPRYRAVLGTDRQIVARGNAEPYEPMPRKAGGKAAKFEGTPKDVREDKKLAKKHHMSMKEWEASSLDAKHDKQRSAKGLKRGGEALDGKYQGTRPTGGRIAKKDGGSLAGLEMNKGGRAKRADGGANDIIRAAKKVAKKLPYQTGYEQGAALAGRSDESYRKRRGEDLRLTKMMREEAPERIREDAVKTSQKNLANLRAARAGMKEEGYMKGGRTARKSGGRAKGKTNINIVIGTGQRPPMAPGLAPGMPQPPAGGIPVPVPPAGAGAAPMPPMPAAAPAPMAMPGAGPAPMARKRGGRTYRSYKDMDAGAGSGLGRLEKTEIQKHKK